MISDKWDWFRFKGSGTALKLNRRDLPDLERVIALTNGRAVAVQAGGNLGIWPKRLSSDFAAVYTFEPASDLFPLLQLNAPERNIVKFQAALGDRHELIGMSRERRDGKTRPPHEGITHVSGNGIIPTLRIDDFGFPICDLLCLDLEGWELYALRGAMDTLNRCRPVIMVEINEHIREVGLTQEAVRDFLTAHGYRQHSRLTSDDVWLPKDTL